MTFWLKRLAYPLFGLLILGGYAYTVRGGIEPFEVSNEKRVITPGAHARTGGYRRGPRVIWFTGFGGK